MGPDPIVKEDRISWLVKKIRAREAIEAKPELPLFESLDEKVPLFLEATLLDSLHDMWRLNSEKLIYRLGVIMGHKLRVELSDKLEMEDVGTWEAAVEQVPRMLAPISTKVSVTKVSRLYARFEREGCPCRRMGFSLDYCPYDVLVDGMMAGFVQRSLGDDRIYCRRAACARESEEGVCVHELMIKED